MPINDKQRAFINEYMVNGHNATKAYHKAYPDSSDKACESNGARLIRNDKIVKAMAGLREDMAEKAEYTQQDSIDRLTRYADAAEANKQFSSAVSSVIALNRMFGWDKDNQLNTEEPEALSPDQIQEALKASETITSIKLAAG